jgi:hypothetical protein
MRDLGAEVVEVVSPIRVRAVVEALVGSDVM